MIVIGAVLRFFGNRVIEKYHPDAIPEGDRTSIRIKRSFDVLWLGIAICAIGRGIYLIVAG